jgi:hypothetical protein
MNLELWKSRLIEQCPLLLGQVFLAVELASTEPNAVTPPCAFVVPINEKTVDSKGALQNAVHQIAIVTVVRNVSDVRGGEAYLELKAMRSSVKKALIRWHPETGAGMVKHLDGTANYFDDFIVSWIDRFECDYSERFDA